MYNVICDYYSKIYNIKNFEIRISARPGDVFISSKVFGDIFPYVVKRTENAVL